MDASGNNSPDLVVTTQGTGPGELVYLAAGQQIAVSGLSVSISGISISAGPTTTTQASTGVTGGFVWLAGSQTISVQVSGVAPTTTASGLSGVTGLPVWVANPSGTGDPTYTSQSSLTTGVGVWLAPTQTVTAAISGVTPTTTASGLVRRYRCPRLGWWRSAYWWWRYGVRNVPERDVHRSGGVAGSDTDIRVDFYGFNRSRYGAGFRSRAGFNFGDCGYYYGLRLVRCHGVAGVDGQSGQSG